MIFIDITIKEVNSAQDIYPDPSYEGEYIRQKGGTTEVLKLTPGKPWVTESKNNVCKTLKIVVWVKIASQVWWPAEVMEGRSTLADSCKKKSSKKERSNFLSQKKKRNRENKEIKRKEKKEKERKIRE